MTTYTMLPCVCVYVPIKLHILLDSPFTYDVLKNDIHPTVEFLYGTYSCRFHRVGSNTAEGRNLAQHERAYTALSAVHYAKQRGLFNAVLQPPSNTILAKCLPRVNSQRVDDWVIVLFLDQLISLPISPITCCTVI